MDRMRRSTKGSMRARLREAVNRVRSFFHKRERDAELDAEMAVHLELAIEENLQRGMTQREARRQALIRFGGVEQAKERHREASTTVVDK